MLWPLASHRLAMLGERHTYVSASAVAHAMLLSVEACILPQLVVHSMTVIALLLQAARDRGE